MSIDFIENDRIKVGVRAAYGARVVNLIDKATGRDWMTQGGQSGNTGEDAGYQSPEAVGWDECFPTVSPWDGRATAWERRLRDHGDLWGRPFAVEAHGATAITHRRDSDEIAFARTLSLAGDTLTARYRIENHGDNPLPYLWALHALLAVKPADRIELPGVDMVTASYLSLGGRPLPTGEIAWPSGDGALALRLDEAQPAESAFAAKLLATGAGGSAAIGHGPEWLTIGWDETIRDLGIWLTYGAWPKPGPGAHYEIAIEPTTARADHLGQAVSAGAPPLMAGAAREWTAWMRVGRR